MPDYVTAGKWSTFFKFLGVGGWGKKSLPHQVSASINKVAWVNHIEPE